MKFTDIKDLSVAELKKKKSALTSEMFEAKMKNNLGQLSNPVQIKFIRRNIARLNMALGLKSSK